jgi:hypothetical protein
LHHELFKCTHHREGALFMSDNMTHRELLPHRLKAIRAGNDSSSERLFGVALSEMTPEELQDAAFVLAGLLAAERNNFRFLSECRRP